MGIVEATVWAPVPWHLGAVPTCATRKHTDCIASNHVPARVRSTVLTRMGRTTKGTGIHAHDGSYYRGCLCAVSKFAHRAYKSNTFLYLDYLWGGMGLFSPSKSKLANRIEELRTRVDRVKYDAERAEREASKAAQRAWDAERNAEIAEQTVEEYASAAAALAKVAQDQAIGDIDTIPDREHTIQTLDEPHLAWKATENYVVRLLLPEGTVVVHPKHGTSPVSKKRVDQAIVLSFHDVNQNGKPGQFKRYQHEVEDTPALDTIDNSNYDHSFDYEVGEMVHPKNGFSMNMDERCTEGIHVFPSQDEALNWYLGER